MDQPLFCYVVLAHTGTAAVARLVRRIRELSPTAQVVVRLGPESDLDFEAINAAGAHVLESAVDVEWGTWSQTESEVEALAEAREHLPHATHFVVVSGQDHPVRDLAAWEREVAASGVDALLDPMPVDPLSVERRWFVVRAPRMPHLAQRVLAAAAWRLPRVTGDRVHANPSPRDGDTRWWVGVPHTPRAGLAKAALWKTLSARGVDALVERFAAADGDAAAERDHVRTLRLPDEVYSPTALTNAPGLVVEHGPTSYTSWPDGASSPEWLELRHVPLAAASGAPFARKLAPDASDELVAALDAAANGHPAVGS